MKAMVLAAGLGTRLRPLTDDRPKALVEIGGRPLLEITLTRLKEFGVCDVIVNLHHFADMVQTYLRANGNFGMEIALSREDVLLDTGGGLKKAGWFFLENPPKTEEPFLLHNVDVISTIDFNRLLQAHRDSGALATLAMQSRESSRPLLFDERMRFRGRALAKDQTGGLAFTGVHVISPRLLREMREEGAFSIIDLYVRLAAAGERIMGFQVDEYYWRDLGKPEQVRQAEEDFRIGRCGS